VALQSGYDVKMYDIADEFLAKARKRIEGNFRKGIEKNRMTAAESQQYLSIQRQIANRLGRSRS
jgi:3-hydroxyacyl-CoA dehydrogenase